MNKLIQTAVHAGPVYSKIGTVFWESKLKEPVKPSKLKRGCLYQTSSW
jgi:hypothetical protein